ncbi:MAG: biotin--[acetyl-CoA-carboxylase] ligase [Christensenellaceae bacterium]|jgi:BirA family biotin operon repressor/biotin-[acetyl-CoA-carboxylase] ligase|nr:biotin--[acetyl-CoA-carboxylase] ligase [Christensenellaceae bacterium]
MGKTKQEILNLLEANYGKGLLSGAKIGKMLGITRSAVSKTIISLQNQGYPITAIRPRGYELVYRDNIINAENIKPLLCRPDDIDNAKFFTSIGSTNEYLREQANMGAGHGLIAFADSQTFGRGRRDHLFYSPKWTGIYISFLLRGGRFRTITPASITMSAAVAVCNAIAKISDKKTSIKWVNDILIDRKKICGIGTEALQDFVTGETEWVVLGIGINVATDSFPTEIEDIATSIFPEMEIGLARKTLTAELINLIMDDSFASDFTKMITDYKNRLEFVGEVVKVISSANEYYAKIRNIDQTGALIVELANGDLIPLHAGEIRPLLLNT